MSREDIGMAAVILLLVYTVIVRFAGFIPHVLLMALGFLNIVGLILAAYYSSQRGINKFTVLFVVWAVLALFVIF